MSSASVWSFNFRSSNCADSDSDDSDSEASTNAHFSMSTGPSSEIGISAETKLWNDLDLSSRDETVEYKPNPFNIAKINAAARAQKSNNINASLSSAPIRLDNAASSNVNTNANSKKVMKTAQKGTIVDGFKKQTEKYGKGRVDKEGREKENAKETPKETDDAMSATTSVRKPKPPTQAPNKKFPVPKPVPKPAPKHTHPFVDLQPIFGIDSSDKPDSSASSTALDPRMLASAFNLTAARTTNSSAPSAASSAPPISLDTTKVITTDLPSTFMLHSVPNRAHIPSFQANTKSAVPNAVGIMTKDPALHPAEPLSSAQTASYSAPFLPSMPNSTTLIQPIQPIVPLKRRLHPESIPGPGPVRNAISSHRGAPRFGTVQDAPDIDSSPSLHMPMTSTPVRGAAGKGAARGGGRSLAHPRPPSVSATLDIPEEDQHLPGHGRLASLLLEGGDKNRVCSTAVAPVIGIGTRARPHVPQVSGSMPAPRFSYAYPAVEAALGSGHTRPKPEPDLDLDPTFTQPMRTLASTHTYHQPGPYTFDNAFAPDLPFNEDDDTIMDTQTIPSMPWKEDDVYEQESLFHGAPGRLAGYRYNYDSPYTHDDPSSSPAPRSSPTPAFRARPSKTMDKDKSVSQVSPVKRARTKQMTLDGMLVQKKRKTDADVNAALVVNKTLTQIRPPAPTPPRRQIVSQTPAQATRNQDSSNSKKRKVKEKDAYDSVSGGDDESWSTLSAKKKKGKSSVGLGVGSSPRDSTPNGIRSSGGFTLGSLGLGKNAKAGKTGMRADDKRRVVTFLPPPLLPATSTTTFGSSAKLSPLEAAIRDEMEKGVETGTEYEGEEEGGHSAYEDDDETAFDMRGVERRFPGTRVLMRGVSRSENSHLGGFEVYSMNWGKGCRVVVSFFGVFVDEGLDKVWAMEDREDGRRGYGAENDPLPVSSQRGSSVVKSGSLFCFCDDVASLLVPCFIAFA
ncbi:hypothetical protein VKT23_019358 [Stygiomarasmius scandens]|uniref:Uncharacterized protein n=1 Tax=Marasmiellus scandens TaxID=2682957 RepID=A0ABR1INV8_9AGAR